MSDFAVNTLFWVASIVFAAVVGWAYGLNSAREDACHAQGGVYIGEQCVKNLTRVPLKP